MKKLACLLLIASGVVLIACEANTEKEIAKPSSTTTPTPVAPENPVAKTVTYTNDVKNIISSNCLGCHGAGGTSPTLTSYSLVKSASESGKLLCVIQAKDCRVMPISGKMPQTTIDVILTWASKNYVE